MNKYEWKQTIRVRASARLTFSFYGLEKLVVDNTSLSSMKLRQ